MRVFSPLVLILIHSLLVSFALIVGVFYLFPHDFYFATPVYAIAPVIFFFTNYLVPAGTRLLPFKDTYLQTLIFRPAASWSFTIAALALALAWTLVMFDSLYNRYTYMRSIDGALSSIGVDGMALPEPAQLAKAFNAEPDRPEVPFILTRAARLLSADLLTPMFGKYNKAFLDGIDRNAVLKRFEKYKLSHRVAIGNDDSTLPRRDPIVFLTTVAFETNQPAEQQWALTTLSDLRKDDLSARLLIEVWKYVVSDTGDVSPAKLTAMQATIDTLDRLLQTNSGTDFSSISFVSDHLFQQGLDYVASLKIALQAHGMDDAQKCRYNNDIIGNYERILVLRRRLSNATDLLWWEPPGKMFLYYIYLYLGHQTINIGLEEIDMIKKCPTLLERLQRMYDAPAFRSFQNPDVWMQGTPMSPVFNGAAGVRQLRAWLKRGW